MTYGDMMAELQDWLKEPCQDSLLFSAINSAVAELWEAEIRVAISNFMGGPVNVSIAQSDERVPVTLITNPGAPPAATTVAGGNLPNRTLYYAFTYVADGGAETLPSSTGSITVAAPNLLVQVPSPALVANAIGWNLYVSNGPTLPLFRQNQDPLPFKDNTGAAYPWQEPIDGIDVGPGTPVPTANTTGNSICYINKFELQMPDLTWRAWNQSELDSVMMRRLEASIASASPFQQYAYDFINNSRIEIRPAAGAAMVPRFFYVYRPPRATLRSATIPFPSAGEYSFVKYKSLSQLLIGKYEQEAASAWAREAEASKLSVLLALNQTNRKRDNTITPYCP